MTEKEKSIYNLHLRISRSIKGLPFKLREDFSGFEEKDPIKYDHLQKLVKFFQNHSFINEEIFIKSPYIVYKDVDYFPLDYYISLKAVKCYRIYNNYIMGLSPDSPEQLEFIKRSLQFIYKYCEENKINVDDYIVNSGKGCILYCWEEHIKEKKVSIYALFGFESFQTVLFQIPKDEQEIYLEGVIEKYVSLKTNYLNSKYAIKFIKEGLKKINTKLLNSHSVSV